MDSSAFTLSWTAGLLRRRALVEAGRRIRGRAFTVLRVFSLAQRSKGVGAGRNDAEVGGF